jgi:hypothetical protein
MADGDDPYALTPFQESNAILLAGLVRHDRDPEAGRRLEELLGEMSIGELDRLYFAAWELIDQVVDARDDKHAEEARQGG